MNQKGRNVAASVQARLLQLSRASKLSLQDLLERYCTERMLYRLSRSPHRSRFILKGAMMLIAWGEGSSERVTRDADLLGFGDNSPKVVRTAPARDFAEVVKITGAFLPPAAGVAGVPCRGEQGVGASELRRANLPSDFVLRQRDRM